MQVATNCIDRERHNFSIQSTTLDKDIIWNRWKTKGRVKTYVSSSMR